MLFKSTILSLLRLRFHTHISSCSSIVSMVRDSSISAGVGSGWRRGEEEEDKEGAEDDDKEEAGCISAATGGVLFDHHMFQIERAYE